MSLRLEMLQVARLAPGLLGDSTGSVRRFFLSRQSDDGGFKDRAGGSDLYYTVFGLDGLTALGAVQNEKLKTQNRSEDVRGRFERAVRYLEAFANGEELDFVHLCCLIRCRAAICSALKSPVDDHSPFVQRLETFRSRDGGYNPRPASEAGTAYAAFLALGAHQDMGLKPPDSPGLVQSLKFLETADGGWANERSHAQSGSTNATAAAVTVLRNLQMPVNPAVGEWLLARAHPQGGFAASPAAPLPDLLSTATALHALAGMEVSFASLKEPCLDFVDSLWTNAGGFHGHWADDALDCEYTFYGLLALGHLSL